MTKDTNTKILDSAEKLILTKGFNAFSYNDISKAVGIKTASIHYHYPSKNDLSYAVAKRFKGAFIKKIEELEQVESSGLKRIEKYGNMIVNAFDKGKGFCLCMSLATDESSLSEETCKVVREFFKESERWVKKAITKGQTDGEIKKDLDPSATATSIVGLFEGTLVVARAYQTEKPLKDVVNWVKLIIKE